MNSTQEKFNKKENLKVILREELLSYALEHSIKDAVTLKTEDFFKEHFDILVEHQDYALSDVFETFHLTQDEIDFVYTLVIEDLNQHIQNYKKRGLLTISELIEHVFKATENLHTLYRQIILGKLTNINYLDNN